MQKGGHRQKILIIDDTPANIQVLHEILRDDYDMFFATTGEDGLLMAARILPDLILLDIMMPEMDGYQVCLRLKENPLTRRVPVIFVTAMATEEEEAKGLECGAVDYIAKPISAPVVRIRVRNQMELLRRSQMLESLTEELAKKNKQLLLLSRKDGLTGLGNRRSLDETLASELRRALRSGKTLSLILCDIDFFKKYNDHYGHQAGDEALRRIGALLQHLFQRGSDFPCRYGGEEFMVILPDTSSTRALDLAENLRLSMLRDAIPHEHSEISDCVTLSIGVVSATVGTGRDAEWFIWQADAALYRSKKEGRNRVTAVTFGDI